MGKDKIITGTNSGVEYVIDKEIGRGGQGRVFSINGGKYAFKLIGKKSSIKSQLLKRKISYIKTRPIEDLPISKPLEQVDGEALGYIMEMATDMMPIENLIKPEGDFVEWWKTTGGLKKRLILLSKIASTLAKLHSRGLVYGDFSLSNIFVSKEADYSEIFFIDSDNITHDSKVGTAIYTPGYAAPEIIQSDDHKATSGYDTYTDNYSFALIAYYLLTLNHPFIGEYVNEGEPELEEKAYLGQIPWVNHSSDNINSVNSGIPSSLTVSKKMMDAFRRTFEDGISQRSKRVTSLQWKEILSGAINAIVDCTNEVCQQHYFFNRNINCPFCQENVDYVGMAKIHPLIKTMKEDVKYNYSVRLENIKDIGEAIKTKILSPDKYFHFIEDDFLLNSSNKELFKVKITDDNIFIKGESICKVDIISNGKMKHDINITNEIKGSFAKDFTLLLEPSANFQFVLKIRKHLS